MAWLLAVVVVVCGGLLFSIYAPANAAVADDQDGRQSRTADGISYRAAVIEYAGTYIPDRRERHVPRAEAVRSMLDNVGALDELMHQAFANAATPPPAAPPAQVVVWPEDALYGPFNLGPVGPSRDELLPFCETLPAVNIDGGGEAVPVQACGNATFAALAPVVEAMACVAKRFGTYLVGTVGDVHWCRNSTASAFDCPPDGRFQYNTAVALDPRGRLVARYHKTHLFQEPQWNAGAVGDVSNLATFRTDFGVEFAVCICFDLLFTWPVQEYLARGVRDFAVPIWWVNQDTLQTAGQAQQAWARANRANLLAANSGLSLNFSGSGIYQGDGQVLASQFNPTKEGVSRVLVADVFSSPPRHPQPVSSHPLSPASFAGRLLQLKKTRLRPSPPLTTSNDGSVVIFDAMPGARDLVRVSNNGLACSASYAVSRNTPAPFSRYALFAYRGNFRGELVEEICAVTRCALPAPRCIGWTTEATTEFEELAVGGLFERKGLRFDLLGVDGARLAPPATIVPYEDGVKLNHSAPEHLPTVLLNLAAFNYPEVHPLPPRHPAEMLRVRGISVK